VIVEDVCVLLGDPADLSLTVRVKDPDDIFPFVTEHLRTMDGVDNTATSIESWTCSVAREAVMVARRPRRERSPD